MRKNLTKEKIRKGEAVYGVFVSTWSPTIVEALGHIGFDFVVLDAEHGPMSPESIEHLVRAADCVNITPVVRVAVNIRQNVLRYLDTGALGVMIPLITSKAEAEAVVEAVKYPPEGKRGLAAVRWANYGLTGPLSDYVKQSNQETMVIIQIETLPAIDNLKEILSVTDVDVVFIGPVDLSVAMGHYGEVNHPEVQEKVDYLVREIRASGKVAGTTANSLEIMTKNKERGFRCLTYSVIPMLARSGREYLDIARS
jgi:4-hydroxy-2-oxoheptanedioate aldolase